MPYFRIHWAGRDAEGVERFAAENAWSSQMGLDWTWVDVDGERVPYIECLGCGGTGEGDEWGLDADGEPSGALPCRSCRGERRVACDRGYSCWDDAELLVEAMTYQVRPDACEDVVVFEGRQVGTGLDGEPLVVPTQTIRWMTWAELVAETKGESTCGTG
jgi:hypothetical protein